MIFFIDSFKLSCFLKIINKKFKINLKILRKEDNFPYLVVIVMDLLSQVQTCIISSYHLIIAPLSLSRYDVPFTV